MKYLQILFILSFFISCASDEKQVESKQETEVSQSKLTADFLTKGYCGDVLKEIGVELDKELFQFDSCYVDNLSDQTIYCTAYHVKGSQAQLAEAFLMKEYKMDSLKFVCCGWEDKTGKYIDFGEREIGGEIISFIGRFNSEETLINDRNKWSEIPLFGLTVEVARI